MSALDSVNGWEALPDNIEVWNGEAQCDMRIGPCACGATHTEEEWARRIGLSYEGHRPLANPWISE